MQVLIVAGLGVSPTAPAPAPIMSSTQELSAVVSGVRIAPAVAAPNLPLTTASLDLQGGAGGFGIQSISVNTGLASANQSAVSVIANVIMTTGGLTSSVR